MKKICKLLSLVLAIVITAGIIPSAVMAAELPMTIAVSEAKGIPGSDVSVTIALKNNPGISSVKLNVAFDDILTLNSVEYNAELGGQSLPPQKTASPVTLTWVSPFADYGNDAVFATLNFTVSDTAEPGSSANVTVTFNPDDIYNMSEQNINCSVTNGKVTVISCIAGDINGDQKVNNKDVTRMFQYLANWDVEVNEATLDVNGDGSVNNKDLTRLFQYMANWDVEIHCKCGEPAVKCTHEMAAISEIPAACESDGNIAYWHCTKCDKYFSDVNGVTEIELKNTVVPATGHTVVIDKAVDPTYENSGLTEGSHCSKCLKVIVEQQVIPPLQKDEYTITYNIAHNDTYLSTIDLNSQIPESARKYTTEDGLYELPLLEVEGYDFIGWFDGTSSQAKKVTEIPAKSKGNKTLYAQWEIKNYTITFESSLVTVQSISNHTVNKATSLPGEDVMQLYGYRWLGWSDENGELYSAYPMGKAGNVTLHANWQSFRNQAVPVEKLGEPKILEDQESGKYLFTFELGTIKNVPLQVINDFGKMVPGQPVTQETVKNTVSIGQESAKTIANTVAKSTTKTATWTLANEWNKIGSVSKTHCEELGMDSEQVKYDFSSNSNHIALSSDMGGSKNETVNWGVNAKIYGKKTNELSGDVKIPIKCANFGIGAKRTTEVGGEVSGYYDKTTVDNSYWNTKSAYQESNNTANSLTTRNSLSQFVSDQYNYSSTESVGGSQSSSEAVAVAESTAEEYSSTIAYRTDEIVEKSYTTTYSTELEGWWRQLIVGTVHVIGVVDYDIKTGTYSVFTYNVLDSKTSRYMDYSKVSNDYNDFENGFIPFEVPYSVNEYISYALGYSDGLIIDKETGIITEYNENAEHVHIPDYCKVSNGDDTYTAVKVTGIKPGVFAGKTNIKSVRLGKYITSIPDNAFKGCSALETIEYENLTSIGENAFAGCSSLKSFEIDTSVTSVGLNAFKDVPEIIVNAANSSVVKNATVSGAKTIKIYLKGLSDTLDNTILAVPETTESYALYGRDSSGKAKEYRNLRIDSAANETIINGITFTSNSGVALKLASENVTLSEVNISNAPAFAIILTADATNLYLMNKSTVSTSGANAILAHSLRVIKAPGTNTATSLTSNGKLLWCNSFTDDGGLYSGENAAINEESYRQLLNDSLPWVLESEMPAGATVVNTKWSYDLTTNITSSSSYVEGYTLYNTTSVWGDYGSWSGWSTNAAYASDSRQVETKTVTDRNGYKQYTLYYYRYWNSEAGRYYYTYSPSYGGTRYTIDVVDGQFQYYGTYGGYCGYSLTDSSMKKFSGELWFMDYEQDIPPVTHTEYRYRDRQLIYTYYHTKTEAKESATEITASDVVTNVKKWVQYVIN